MRKLTVLLTLIASLLALSVTASADSPVLTVEDYSISRTVSPGDTFTVNIVLDNKGEETAQNVDVQLKTSYPVSVRDITKKRIDDIRENWDKSEVDFELEMEDSASEGNYPIQFVISYMDSDDNQYTKNYVVNVPVEGEEEASLHLHKSSATDVYSGDSVSLTFEVLNEGSEELQSLVTTSSAEGPMLVKWDSRERSIGNLGPYESDSFEVEVETNKTASTDKYPVKLVIQGDNLYTSETFKIPVIGKPDFEIAKVETGKVVPGAENVPVEIHLTNRGGNSAEDVEVELLPRYPFSAKATTKFTEVISVNETEKMDFYLDVDDDTNEGGYSVELILDYETDGEDFSETLEFPLEVEKSKPLVAKYWWLAPIVVILLTGIYITQNKEEFLKEG